MPIAVGEQVGSFVIRAPLGKGGMGEVYQALDPRLGRDVAIKILPAEAIASAERRASFVQEAKLASALNHRNIVTIYDIDTAEVDGKPVDFIAMEYVHGRTLDQVIGRRGLRLTEALSYAQQIADGLSAAHRVGIIHRDLKPTNIIVNENGEIKILDFGLAKLIEPEEADAWAPTQSVPVETAGGTIAGTAAYMSPEQAEGQWVDERSDIFSFGAVLYEMITGRRAFPGASKLSTLVSVLHTDPAPIVETRDPLPRELERIIERCLRKDPRRRWQNVADLKIAIEDLSQEWDVSKAAAAEKTSRSWTRRRGLHLFVWLTLTVLALAAGGYIGAKLLTWPRPTFQRLTYRRGDISGAKFSPDGTVLFSAQWAAEPTTIFSTRLGRSESRPLGLPSARIFRSRPTGNWRSCSAARPAGRPGRSLACRFPAERHGRSWIT